MAPAKKAKAVKKAARPTRTQIVLTDAALFQAAFTKRTIAASKIYRTWLSILGQQIQNPNDAPARYRITNVIAYADFLNKSPQFMPYHLDLQPADVANVSTMGQLGGAIVGNFRKNGWTVTPN